MKYKHNGLEPVTEIREEKSMWWLLLLAPCLAAASVIF